MLKIGNTFILTEEALKELLKSTFKNGALSYAKWDAQRDTCWSNVNQDMEEEVVAVLSDIPSSEVENN